MVQFLKQLWHNWVVLMSGIGSIISAFYAARNDLQSPALPLWLVAFGCLLVSAFFLWWGKHRQMLSLQAELAEAKDFTTFQQSLWPTLVQLHPDEAQLLLSFCEYDTMNEDQISEVAEQRKLKAFDLQKISRLGFIDWSEGGRCWTLKQSIAIPLKRLLKGFR